MVTSLTGATGRLYVFKESIQESAAPRQPCGWQHPQAPVFSTNFVIFESEHRVNNGSDTFRCGGACQVFRPQRCPEGKYSSFSEDIYAPDCASTENLRLHADIIPEDQALCTDT